MVDIPVRGQYGVQLLQAAAGLSKIAYQGFDGHEPRIVVNNGGSVIPHPADKLHPDHKNPICVKNCSVVIDLVGTDKTPYWTPGAATGIFSESGYAVIQNFLSFDNVNAPETAAAYTVLHVRGHDKKMASIDSYVNLMNHIRENRSGNVWVLGDDEEFIDSIMEVYASQPHFTRNVKPNPFAKAPVNLLASVYSSYNFLLGASLIYSAPSAFVLSTLLYDRYKSIVIMGEKSCDGPYTNMNDYIFIREAMSFCPNLRLAGI